MRVLIATPLYPPDVGGPATYAVGLERSLKTLGHEPMILFYREVLGSPKVARQLIFAYKVFIHARNVQAIISLDTLSIGLPAVCVAKLLRIPSLVRVAGDQVWERYVNRTKEAIPFPEFYEKKRKLSTVEKIMQMMTGITFALADKLVFSTKWQEQFRTLGHPSIAGKTTLIENAYTDSSSDTTFPTSEHKIFLWAGRDIPLKNVELLKRAFSKAEKRVSGISLMLLRGVSHAEVMAQMKDAYAVILPSYSDDSPNLILEGLSLGKPYIVTKFSGLEEKIADMGISLDPRDEEAVADAIVQMTDARRYEDYKAKIEKFKFIHTYDDIAEEFIQLIIEMK